jgi:phage/conjugal plasmid C-4 type zinc finger TraR family protein
MASGWAKDGAVQEQIDASVAEAVKLARSRIGDGEGLIECEDCAEEIPQARREAVPGVRRCIACQESFDQKQHRSAGINRRGSKDSQLR